MIKYVFRDAPLIINNVDEADPQKIGEALDKIARANQGQLKPEAVVVAASNKKSPLHPHFEWDDQKAASAFRLSQARHLIRAVSIEAEEEGEDVPAFHSISDKGGRSYRHHTEVIDSARLRKLVVQQAKRDLEAFKQRYSRLSDLFEPGVSNAIARMEDNDQPGA